MWSEPSFLAPLSVLSKSKVTLTTPNACVTIPSGLLFHGRIFPHRRGADKSFICILNRRKYGSSHFASSNFSKRILKNGREITSTHFGFLLRVASGYLIRIF
jgi:hypothetical protein